MSFLYSKTSFILLHILLLMQGAHLMEFICTIWNNLPSQSSCLSISIVFHFSVFYGDAGKVTGWNFLAIIFIQIQIYFHKIIVLSWTLSVI